jgi:hypothetical protein
MMKLLLKSFLLCGTFGKQEMIIGFTKTWSFLQVFHAVSAHLHTNILAWGEPPPPPMANRFFVASPSSMEGFNCYTDASTTPDHMSNGITSAGLGIYIINSQMQPPVTITFKAVLRDSQSVFVAEAAALAFATSLLHFMQLDHVNFFTDCRGQP